MSKDDLAEDKEIIKYFRDAKKERDEANKECQNGDSSKQIHQISDIGLILWTLRVWISIKYGIDVIISRKCTIDWL
jgi:hypothetical protein